MRDGSDKFVCHNCLNEDYLSREVCTSGAIAKCSFCGDESASIELDELAESVHWVIEKFFVLTASEPRGYEYALAKEGLWERDGYPIGDVVCEEIW